MTANTLRIVQVSDLHLSLNDQGSRALFDRVAQAINALKPDRIVLTGDLTNDGCANPRALAWGRELIRAFAMPIHVLPGNHDVGDKIGNGETPVTADRLASWRGVFGEDHFSFETPGWRLLGFDSLIAGSGLPDDAAQIDWLGSQLLAANTAGQRVAVFTHEPPFLGSPGRVFSDKSDYWPLHVDAQPAYMACLTQPHVRLVASGHVHWRNDFLFLGARHVWCPSPAFIVDDAKFPRGGGVLGFYVHEFGPGDPGSRFVPTDTAGQTIYFNQPRVQIPGRSEELVLAELTLDFTGTLSKEGRLLSGVADRIRQIAMSTRVTVLSADTFGTCQKEMRGLPVAIEIIRTGQDKETYIKAIGRDKTIHVGNGKNDVMACQTAAVAIGVIGPEGAASDLIHECDVVVTDIRDALDLVLEPKRLGATLRE